MGMAEQQTVVFLVLYLLSWWHTNFKTGESPHEVPNRLRQGLKSIIKGNYKTRAFNKMQEY